MSWEAACRRWLEELESRQYSPATLAVMRGWTTRLVDYLEALGLEGPVDVTRAHLDSWRQHLSWGPGRRCGLYAANTVDQGLRVTRDFFRWAAARRFLLVDPAAHWVLFRPPSSLKTVLTVVEMEKLLDVSDAEGPTGLRDRAVLETFYSTAIRLGECHRLNLEDVEWPLGMVRIRHGKGARDRRVPLGPALGAVLSKYLAESRPHLVKSPTEPALFVSRLGARLGVLRYQQVVWEACAKAGLPRISPHGLRHACAAHLLQGGADISHIKQLLGHQHVQTTQLYTRLWPDALSQVHLKTHPRARLSEFEPPEQPEGE